LPACLAQHPVADRDDQAGSLRQGHEDVGRDHAALGVLPAKQRLGADDEAIEEAHEGLVDHGELACV
jgi:hypothetical protein